MSLSGSNAYQGSRGSASRLDPVAPETLGGCGIGLIEALGEVLQGSGVPGFEDPAPDLFAIRVPVRHVQASHQDVERIQIPFLAHVGEPLVGLGAAARCVELFRESPHGEEIAGLGGPAQQVLEILEGASGLLDLLDRGLQHKVFARFASTLPQLRRLHGVPRLLDPAGQDHQVGGLPGLDVAAQPLVSLIRPARVIETLVELHPHEVREMVIRFRCSDEPPLGVVWLAVLVEPRRELLHGDGVAGLGGAA